MLSFLRKRIKGIMIVVAVLFAASMFYGLRGIGRLGGFTSGKQGRQIARVNGKAVDPYRYREIMNRLARQYGNEINLQNLALLQNMALEQSLDFMLILERAKRNVRVAGREVDLVIDNIVKQQKLSSVKDLENSLKRSGISLAKFKSMLKEEMLVQKMVTKIRSGVQVTPDDLREVRVSHILVTNEAQARELLARIRQGGNFAALAKKYSKDPGSAAKGGDLGYVTTGMMVEPFEKAAFSLKIGELSDVVKTQYGYHLLKLVDSRLRKFAGEEKDLEKAALNDKQNKVFQKWFYDLKSKAKIEIINSELRGHYLRFRGRLWEAIQEYKKAISQDPANPYLHVFLGDTYAAMAKDDLALAEYEEAVKIEGGNPNLFIIVGQAYQKQGKNKEALTKYRQASVVAGDNKAVHETLLEIFKELKAWADYRKEKTEIARIEKKEKFEKELTGTK